MAFLSFSATHSVEALDKTKMRSIVHVFILSGNGLFHVKRWNVGSRLIIRDVMAGYILAPFCCEFILLLMEKWGNFDRM